MVCYSGLFLGCPQGHAKTIEIFSNIVVITDNISSKNRTHATRASKYSSIFETVMSPFQLKFSLKIKQTQLIIDIPMHCSNVIS